MKRLIAFVILALAVAPLTACVVTPARPYAGASWVPGHYGPYGGWVRGHYN